MSGVLVKLSSLHSQKLREQKRLTMRQRRYKDMLYTIVAVILAVVIMKYFGIL